MTCFVGALVYVDDITLLAPTPYALRKLLAVCKSIGTNLMLKFNPDKTQCIRFSWKPSGGCSSVLMFCGKYIECVKSVLHLGHVLAENLQDDLDIQQCHSDSLSGPTVYYIDLLFVPLWFCLICCAAFVCHTMVMYCGI